MMREPTAAEREQERAFLYTVTADGGIFVMLIIVTLASGSLTMLSELVRGAFLMGIELYTLWLLFAIHRGRLTRYQYGTGKLEQLIWVIVGCGLVIGALWVAQTVVRTLLVAQTPASPLGLALAAILNAVNLGVNFLGWYSMWRAAAGKHTGVIAAELSARFNSFLGSAILQVTLTAATLAKDPGLVLIFDALGATFVVLLTVRRGIVMVARGLPDLLDAPASDEILRRLRQAVQEAIPQEYRIGMRTRRSGGTTFAEVDVSAHRYATVAALEAARAEILSSVGSVESEVDLCLRPVAAPEAGEQRGSSALSAS